jgi:hypothetical protein
VSGYLLKMLIGPYMYMFSLLNCIKRKYSSYITRNENGPLDLADEMYSPQALVLGID